jgi:phosphoenolpyruvate carboxykinase (GTP)
MSDVQTLLKQKLTAESFEKIAVLQNEKFFNFLADSIELCQPDDVFIVTDSDQDAAYVREMAISNKEATVLKIAGHPIHFDGARDQGRDRKATKYLVPKTDSLSKALNQIEREKGLAEVRGLLEGSMKGGRFSLQYPMCSGNGFLVCSSCREPPLSNCL